MKHVTWNDIVKLGTMNPIVQKNLDELGEMPGITHAYALMAMVDELDGQLERYKLDAMRYRYLRDPQVRPRALDVADNFMSVYDGDDLDQAIDEELAKPGVRESLGAEWFVQRVEKLAAVSREQVLATLRGAGFTDTAETLATLLDDIEQGKTGNEPTKLEPCPRCGSSTINISEMIGAGLVEYAFRCDHCRYGVNVPSMAISEEAEDHACEAWNKAAVAKKGTFGGEKVASDKAEG